MQMTQMILFCEKRENGKCDRITHHENDEGKYEEENKDVKVHSIYEEILIEELEATAKGGDERMKDFLICHNLNSFFLIQLNSRALIVNLLNNSQLFHFFSLSLQLIFIFSSQLFLTRIFAFHGRNSTKIFVFLTLFRLSLCLYDKIAIKFRN